MTICDRAQSIQRTDGAHEAALAILSTLLQLGDGPPSSSWPTTQSARDPAAVPRRPIPTTNLSYGSSSLGATIHFLENFCTRSVYDTTRQKVLFRRIVAVKPNERLL